MIVYNITLKILYEIENEWLEWQKGEHIPAVMATDLFSEYKFYKLLDQDDSDGPTYVIQYFTSTLEKYHLYIKDFASQLRQEAIAKWGDRFVAFRTLLQVVD